MGVVVSLVVVSLVVADGIDQRGVCLGTYLRLPLAVGWYCQTCKVMY